MSCLTKSQLQYVNNDNKKLYLDNDDEDEDDFNFQYVPVNQFKNIIKDVRRQRIRDEEEKVWTTFLKEQEYSRSNCQKNSNELKYKSSRTLAESFEEVDRELMRLKDDALPETYNQTSNRSTRNNQEKNFSVKSEKQNSLMTKENGTDSTNLLLPIPEEKNAYYRSESSESCKHYRTCIKTSCSDQTLKKNRIHTKCYHNSTNDLDYSSSPDISPNQLSNENDSIFEHPDPIVVTKILGIQRKIFTVLDSISNELDRIPLPDGENDFHRRQQRTVEFSTRLSRNYLYDLSRQISDIERHIKAINPDSKMRLSRKGMILHMQAIEQKLISTHQLLLAALSAYWKHIPSSVLKSHPGKLKELLQIVVQLKNICAEIKLVPDFYCSGDDRDAFFGKETENRCSFILSKFRLNSDNESQVPSHTTRSTIVTPCSKKQRNRKILSNRLSMYTMEMRLGKNYQPKKSRNRFQMSKDRKHNCALSKHQQKNVLPISRKLHLTSHVSSSNEAVRNKTTKISVPMKEDDIQTMMETFPSDLDVDSHQSIRSDKKSEIYRESHKAIEIYENEKESEQLKKIRLNGNEKELKDYSIKEECFSTFLPEERDLLIQNEKNSSNLSPLDINDALYNPHKKFQPNVDSNEFGRNTRNQSETGVQNMRLIYYSEKDQEECSQIINIKEHKKMLTFSDASCQANYLKSIGMFKLLVSESVMLCLQEYKNQYHCLLKSNPMYTSNTQNKPWEVVAWIADKLVDELIVELSNEFQMEEIIQKLFELEFQEF